MSKHKMYILAHEDKNSETGYALTPYPWALDGDYFTTIGDFQVEMPDHYSREYITSCRVHGLEAALKELQAKNHIAEQAIKDQIAQLLCLPESL